MQARQDERVPPQGVYIDVHNQDGTEFNSVLRRIYKVHGRKWKFLHRKNAVLSPYIYLPQF